MKIKKAIQLFGILCGILFTSFCISCSKEKKIQSLMFSTTGCYKTCPVLDVKLYKNIVYYNLLEFNDKVGVYKYELTLRDFNELNRLIDNLDIDSLKKEYASNTPDVQVYNTSFVYKGKKKEVFFFENECPKDYQDLIKYLINLKSNQVSKIDTVLNFETRLRIPFEKKNIPPIPDDGSVVN